MPGTLAAMANGNLDDLDALLAIDRERELNIFRSGSAPPTVEGSRNAMDSIFANSDEFFAGIRRSNGRDSGGGGGVVMSEEEMRSHPAYLSYYYSNENLNPRLPPPAISKENWRVARRFQSGASALGGIGDWKREGIDGIGGGSSRSLFSSQPAVHPMYDVDGELELLRNGVQRNLAEQVPSEWVERGSDGLIGLTGVGLGARSKSFADALQEELGQTTYGYSSDHHSRPVSQNDFNNVVDLMGVSDSQMTQLQNGLETIDSLHSGTNSPSLVRVQSLGSSMSSSFASAVGSSLVRSRTPDPQLIGRSLSPSLPALGGMGKNTYNGISSCMSDYSDIATALSGLNLSKNGLIDEENHVQRKEFADQPGSLYSMPNDRNSYLQPKNFNKPVRDRVNCPSFPMLGYNEFSKRNGVIDNNESKLASNRQTMLPNRSSSANLYLKVPAGSAILQGSGGPGQNVSVINTDFSGNNVSGFPVTQRLPPLMNDQLDTGGLEGQYLRNGNQVGSGVQGHSMDPVYSQLLRRTDSAAQVAASLSDPSLGRNLLGTSHMDLSSYQKAYLGALLAQQGLQYGTPLLGKSGNLNQGYYGSPASGAGMPYPTSPISSSILSSLGSGSPVRQGERLSRFPSVMRSSAGASMGSWNSGNGAMGEGFTSSLLEEFKSNKTRSFELFDIVDHVVEFSADQYGSRFIQQKLETASVEEKNNIFPEIFPCARDLMTDVFGNYVIQKFFEHGTEDQRKQLASQLSGHVLPLSLQMYGCRVIQKALEVVDVDRQTQMVLELEGSIMKCVRDQNGNHVIQKCIECVPQERIQFIISAFYGQVVPLSTHPYGCRVIQRVLEHCDDAKTQSIMMEEIMQSICTLAQDQYGNYVVQHVLQHGKKEERSAIISKLAGQIVKMSQQKFASNVIEKCLTYGTQEERQLLIDEMLGSTDENEPLQAMMKDQFANYVVQKVLETCDDNNRELILSRIKVHLNALKRYTYGKHIVARVEKLIAAGERHIGMSQYSA